MENLNTFLNNLIKEMKSTSIDTDSVTMNEKLLFLYAYYHYCNADNSKFEDVLDGDVFSWDSLDHIAGIYEDEEADEKTIDFIISVFTEEEFDFPAVFKQYKEAELAAIAMRERKADIRRAIIDSAVKRDIVFDSETQIRIKLITNYEPKKVSEKKAILNALRTMRSEYEKVTYDISFAYDLEYEILEIENPKEYVDSAEITIDKEGNFTIYGDEESLIANISAQSLKWLYEQYSYRGLFSQNLRYYVKNVKVDENIIDTIVNKGNTFWYYNNGVILICDEYQVRGKTIALKRFSIINGGQTTKLIGETDFTVDFYLQCKIIKNKYRNDDDRIDFIADVAEASNTQKPIKGKDLIANKPEQRRLKKQLADVGIYCQIKRGEKVNKKLYPQAWQNTTNEELGQFILSFVYQLPGAARGAKATITGNAERYSLLFSKRYNSYLLADLLRIKMYYKQWANYVKKRGDSSDLFKNGLVGNGMFFMTSIIGAVYKIYYHEEYREYLKHSNITEQKMDVLSQHDISHRIFKEDIDYKTGLFELFEFCYSHYYRPGYEFFYSFKGKNDYSNFTKINKNYAVYVIKQIEFQMINVITDELRDIFDRIFYSPTKDEYEMDKLLLIDFSNVLTAEFYLQPIHSVDANQEEKIRERLMDFRSRKCREEKKKAFEVFSSIAADRISKYAPLSLEELKQLRCLNGEQQKSYGIEITAIINEVMGNNNEKCQ